MTGLSAAVVDTDVFSVMYLRRNTPDPREARWRDLLTRRRVLISFQTRAEVLAGAVAAGWAERRIIEAREILDRTPTIRPDNDVIEAYASLVANCRSVGHALHAAQHTGDRWVAACAIAKDVDLLAGDAIYMRAPGLSLLT